MVEGVGHEVGEDEAEGLRVAEELPGREPKSHSIRDALGAGDRVEGGAELLGEVRRRAAARGWAAGPFPPSTWEKRRTSSIIEPRRRDWAWIISP